MMSDQRSNAGSSSSRPQTESYIETVLSSQDLLTEGVCVSPPIPNNGTASPTQPFEASAGDKDGSAKNETSAASDPFAVFDVLCAEYGRTVQSRKQRPEGGV
jgi:hypothetical protein